MLLLLLLLMLMILLLLLLMLMLQFLLQLFLLLLLLLLLLLVLFLLLMLMLFESVLVLTTSFQVGALEPQFYSELLKGLEMNSDDLPQFGETEELRRKTKPKTYFSGFFSKLCLFVGVAETLRQKFQERTQAEWAEVFNDSV